jgi:hypothetical protein
MKRHLAHFVTGAATTAAAVASYGLMEWRILTAAAVLGGVGGVCGVNVAKVIRRKKEVRSQVTER